MAVLFSLIAIASVVLGATSEEVVFPSTHRVEGQEFSTIELSTGSAHFYNGGSATFTSRHTGQEVVLDEAVLEEASGTFTLFLTDEQGAAAAAISSVHAAPAALQLTVLGVAPPHGLLVHAPPPAGAALAFLRALPHVLGAAALPPVLRSSLPLDQDVPTAVRLTHVPAHGARVSTALLASPFCGACEVREGGGATLILSGAGGVVSQQLLSFATHLDAVVHVERVTPAARALNAFARGIMQTTDMLNSGDINFEFGTCSDTSTCDQQDALPFSLLKKLYPSIVSGAQREGRNDNQSDVAFQRRMHNGVAAPPEVASSTAALRVAAAVAHRMEAAAAREASAAANVTGPPRQRIARTLSAQRPTPPNLASSVQRASHLRALQATCSVDCASTSCGQGYGECLGIGASSAIALSSLGLDGTGQLVNVVDSGLDVKHPFFLDAANTLTPTSLPPTTLSPHRKVAAYWSYMDADEVSGGHGTHVSGSVAGNAAPVLPRTLLDGALLNINTGMAPGARLWFTDVECSTTGGCRSPTSYPSGCPGNLCPPNDGNFYTPTDSRKLFAPPYASGSRISSNSWGGGNAAYGADSAAIDDFASTHPDMLILFAASNSATFATLSEQAVAKNVLTVGAQQDGILAHYAKILGYIDPVLDLVLPPLFQRNSARSCGAVLTYTSFLCPATLTPSTCYSAATLYSEIPGGYAPGEAYDPDYNTDVALCCGCTPKQVIDGAALIGPITAEFFLARFVTTYNARFKSPFSSAGPTLDGRIKPDLAAPGEDIVSSRSSGSDGKPYTDAFACPTSLELDTYDASQTVVADTGSGPEGLYIASIKIVMNEPVLVHNVTIEIESCSAGTLYLSLYDILWGYGGGAGNGIPPLAVIQFDSAESAPFSFTVQLDVELKPDFVGSLNLFASPGMSITLRRNLDSTYVGSCFGAFNRGFSAVFEMSRGTALSYLMPDSGTSMATPLVSGLAAIVRQYYTGGFYPTGAATAGAGFTPSAALMKATLINSASTALFDNFLKTFFPDSPLNPAEAFAESGHGTPNLVRGLALASVPAAQRSSLLVLGLTISNGAGVDPTITDGQVTTYCIDAAPTTTRGGVPAFSATLTYTDPAASVLAFVALVNNVNLEVLLPGATSPLLGNNAPSTTPQQRDTRNNVEKISFDSPVATLSASGARLQPPYAVTVRGSAVALGPQAYSLVVTGPGLTLSTASCGLQPSPAPAQPSPPAAAGSSTAGAVIGLSVILSLLIVLGAVAGIVACVKGYTCTQGGSRARGAPSAIAGGKSGPDPSVGNWATVNPVMTPQRLTRPPVTVGV